MAKVTNERVEKESETVTRYACNNCDRRYDSRDDERLNVIVLDAEPQRKRNRTYSDWRDMRWGSGRTARRTYFRMKSAAKVDICQESCFSGIFLDSDVHTMDSIDRELRPAIEVEEMKHEVVEQREDEYLCDKCGDSMGTTPDHDVSLNPHFRIERRDNHALGSVRGEVDVQQELPDDDEYIQVGGFNDGRVTPYREDSFDVCHGCAREVFNLGPSVSNNPITRMMESMANGIANGIKAIIP